MAIAESWLDRAPDEDLLSLVFLFGIGDLRCPDTVGVVSGRKRFVIRVDTQGHRPLGPVRHCLRDEVFQQQRAAAGPHDANTQRLARVGGLSIAAVVVVVADCIADDENRVGHCECPER